jgi:PKD repeat protein
MKQVYVQKNLLRLAIFGLIMIGVVSILHQPVNADSSGVFDLRANFPKNNQGENGIYLEGLEGSSYFRLINYGDYSFSYPDTPWDGPAIGCWEWGNDDPNKPVWDKIGAHPAGIPPFHKNADAIIRVIIPGDGGLVRVKGVAGTVRNYGNVRFYIYKGADQYNTPLWSAIQAGTFDFTIPYASGDEIFFATDAITNGYDDWAYWDSAQLITSTVANSPPVLAPIGDKTVDEGELLTFTLAATDPDNNLITFRATGLPAGASLSGGTFTWIPTYSQAGIYPVTFTASDGMQTDSEQISIVVTEVLNPVIFDLRQMFPKDAQGENGIYLEYRQGNSYTPLDHNGDYSFAYTAGNPYQMPAIHIYKWGPGGGVWDKVSVHPSAIPPGNINADGIIRVIIPGTGGDVRVRGAAGNLNNGDVRFYIYKGADQYNNPFWSATQSGSFDFIIPYSTGEEIFFGTSALINAYNDWAYWDGAQLITSTVANSPPVLAPIEDKTVDEGQLLTFSLAASDPDNDPVTFSASGLPAGASLTGDTFAWTPAFDQGGLYTVTFTVSDGDLTGTRDATITVNNINQAPSLDQIEPQSVDEGNLLTFTLSGSDPDEDALTYSAGILPNGAVFDAGTREFTWTPAFDQAGQYTVAFTVSDGALTRTRNAAITVNNVNRAPVADAGADQLLHVIGSTVYLDGSQSYDDDGDVLTYQWSFVSKPAGSSATLAGATTESPTFIADKNGEYTIQLLLSDGTVTSTPDTITCSFLNVKPVADAGASQSAILSETVSLDGSKSYDLNGDALTYQWSFIAVPSGSTAQIANPVDMQTDFVPDKVGTYTVQLIVTDGIVDSDPASIQVEVVAREMKIITDIQNLEITITSASPSAFKNPNMQNTFINKLNAVIADISAADYSGAQNKLQNDVLAKTDGCAASGAPDRNDWISGCTTQGAVYPKILSIINEIKAL